MRKQVGARGERWHCGRTRGAPLATPSPLSRCHACQQATALRAATRLLTLATGGARLPLAPASAAAPHTRLASWLLCYCTPVCLLRDCCVPMQHDPAAVAGRWSHGTSSPPERERQPSPAAGSLRPALSLTLLCPVFSKTGSCTKGELCKMVSRWGCVDAAWQLSASASWQLHGLQQHAKARHACTAR